MIEFGQISINKVIGLTLIAITIFILHKLISLFISKWMKKEFQESWLAVYLPVSINLIWIVFVLYSVYELAIINPIMSVLVSILILIFTYSNAKDFVQGTLFKIQKGNLTGQLIKMSDFTGKVVKMKNTRVHLQLENGEIVQFPYSKLSDIAISVSSSVKDYKKGTFSISAPNTDTLERISKHLKMHLFNIPWIASEKNIRIEIVYQDPKKIEFKIILFTLDEEFVPKIQEAINMIDFK